MSDRYGIKFTIPDDKTPEEQLEMVQDIRKIMVNFAKAFGELDGLDLSDIDEKIATLKSKQEGKG